MDESIWRKCVILTRPNGQCHAEVGYVTTSQSKTLTRICDGYSELVKVVDFAKIHGEEHEPKPSGVEGCGLLDSVVRWLDTVSIACHLRMVSEV